jgi:hypothetical protein
VGHWSTFFVEYMWDKWLWVSVIHEHCGWILIYGDFSSQWFWDPTLIPSSCFGFSLLLCSCTGLISILYARAMKPIYNSEACFGPKKYNTSVYDLPNSSESSQCNFYYPSESFLAELLCSSSQLRHTTKSSYIQATTWGTDTANQRGGWMGANKKIFSKEMKAPTRRTRAASNTRLRLTTQIDQVHVATRVLLNLGTNFQPHRPENAAEHQPWVHWATPVRPVSTIGQTGPCWWDLTTFTERLHTGQAGETHRSDRS